MIYGYQDGYVIWNNHINKQSTLIQINFKRVLLKADDIKYNEAKPFNSIDFGPLSDLKQLEKGKSYSTVKDNYKMLIGNKVLK